MATETIKGSAAIEALAKRFPQLYVAPSPTSQDAYSSAAKRGIAPDNANLNHFETSDKDELRIVDTPAGPVEVLFLETRHDFETFLQIIGHKSQLFPIAPTIGAITYQGLADWGAINAACKAYLESGGTDWMAEFARLASQPGAFRTELIVISSGPYSNIPASKTRYSEEEWLHLSREIRLNHECAHVVCRRLMPDDIKPVWDEITADATGLICAIDQYDPELAALFLGVSDQGFESGRLTEYLGNDQKDDIDAIAIETNRALSRIKELSMQNDLSEPFEFLLALKRCPLIDY